MTDSKQILNNLKQSDLENFTLNFAVIFSKLIHQQRAYNVKYVNLSSEVRDELKEMMRKNIDEINYCREFSFDSPEPDESESLILKSEESDFQKINEQIDKSLIGTDKIHDTKELYNVKGYLLVLSNVAGNDMIIGYKKLDTSWGIKKGIKIIGFDKSKFKEILDEKKTFNIYKKLDLIFHKGHLFIKNKKDFETGLNFRDGMIKKAEIFFQENNIANLFNDIDELKKLVGINYHHLRKIATIVKKEFYKNNDFITLLKDICNKDWKDIVFKDDKIIVSADNLASVLSVLMDKRLTSPLTKITYDIEGSTKQITI